MASKLTLPRVKTTDKITGKEGQPSPAFVIFWEKFARTIERNDNEQAELLELIQQQQEALQLVVDELLAQQEQINNQNSAIERQLILTSYANGIEIIAEADGATAQVTINDHTRVYTDKTVAVTGDVLTGLEYGKAYFLYYDDPTRAGGAVSILATLDPTQAVTSDLYPARHQVGGVTTPATAGDPPNTGGGTRPPGFPPDENYIIP